MPSNFTARFERHKFGMLLAALTLVQLVPVIQGEPNDELWGFLWGIVLFTAVYAAAENRRITVILGTVAILVFSGRIANALAPPSFQNPVEAGGYIAGAIFLGATIFMLMRAIFRAPRINGDTVIGAICVYSLIGFLWTNFYALAYLADPGAFNFPDYAQPSPDTIVPEFTFGYFSFVTLTTLGYGDITPVTFRARTLSWMEAVVGVAFMATTIALLISQLIVDRQKGNKG